MPWLYEDIPATLSFYPKYALKKKKKWRLPKPLLALAAVPSWFSRFSRPLPSCWFRSRAGTALSKESRKSRASRKHQNGDLGRKNRGVELKRDNSPIFHHQKLKLAAAEAVSS